MALESQDSREVEAPLARLFKSHILESLTRVHPLIPLMIWGPLSLLLLWQGRLAMNGLGLMMLGAGFLSWTLLEYVIHRFAFHFPARTALGQWVVYALHGNHHANPKDRLRLLMPPTVSLPFGGVVFLLCLALFPFALACLFFVGMIWGYLLYDYTHFAVHSFELKSGWGRYLKRYHYRHHFLDEKGRWGVSSPLWDVVFRTRGDRIDHDASSKS